MKGYTIQALPASSPTASEVPATTPHATGPMTLGRKIKAYIHLTKPQIIELLLVTTAPTMMFAAHGMPNFWLIMNTLIGGAMAAGASCAFNCYIDRDIDRKMKRTEKRPLVTGELTDREALIFSWILAVISVAYLWVMVNPLSGVLGLAAILLYVVFYSMYLKKRTTQNIVWGGIAGCMPVLIAWAAVRNTIEWPALVLFTVIFLWTPPHYWPLSMKYAEDYKAAGVPMLGAIAPAHAVSVQVVLYGWAMVICSLLLIPIGGAGWVYGMSAAVVGAWFLYHCHKLHYLALQQEATSRTAMVVFFGSITYLTVLFIALAIDPFVGQPILDSFIF